MPNFFKTIKNSISKNINYYTAIRTGEITVDNGDGTYDVKIANASSAIPDVETMYYDDIFSVGEIVDIGFEYGSKEEPKIMGHSKKIAQEPKEIEVDYSGGINMGSLAINRETAWFGNKTTIVKINPANATGKITSVSIWADTDMADVKVATFYVVSGNNLSTRDYETIGSVIAGSKQTFNVDIDVQIGDYLGIYYSSGSIEAVASEIGVWNLFGDNIPCTDITFEYFTAESPLISLYGRS